MKCRSRERTIDQKTRKHTTDRQIDILHSESTEPRREMRDGKERANKQQRLPDVVPLELGRMGTG